MKTIFLTIAVLVTLSFQLKEVTNTYWVSINQNSVSFDNSLELRRQGIKVLACRCHLNGNIQMGQIIGKKCHIRNNGVATIATNFEVLLANSKIKLKAI